MMKLNLPRETLLKPLSTVIGVVERKQTLPILANVLFSIKNNNLVLTGSDAEIELVGQSTLMDQKLPAVNLTLPGRKLMEICRSLPEDASIELYQDKETMLLRSGRSRFKLAMLPADHFPKLTTESSDLSFTISSLELKAMLQRTAFTIAQQELRYYLNGLLLDIETDKITAVATDGHRLALSSANIKTGATLQTQAIVPRKTILELLRLLDNSEQSLGVTVSKGHITFTSNDFTLTSKLIEGKFPQYQRVIPNNLNNTLTFEKDILKQALSRVAIFCSEQQKGVRFELGKEVLKISLNNPQQESAEEEIAITLESEPLDIAFNIVYLLDILGAVSDNQVTFTFGDSNNSIIIKEVNNPHNSLFVVMPMRL